MQEHLLEILQFHYLKLLIKNVFAFEPFEESFKLLKENVGRNNISNIKPVNKSLGNINGERSLYLANDNFQGITSDSNLRKYTEELKVQEVTVDQFVKENNLDVGLITIDVEGAEKDLLSGAVETIKSQNQCCLLVYIIVLKISLK